MKAVSLNPKKISNPSKSGRFRCCSVWASIVLAFGGVNTSLAFASESMATQTMSTSTKRSTAESVLFTQLAASATLKPLKEKDTYLLTLHDVSASTTWFSDRPQRHAGAISTDDFVKRWDRSNSSFREDAPNANMVIFQTNAQGIKESTEHVVELKNPRYFPEQHALTYQIKLLPTRSLSNNTFPKTGQTEEVALFIDSWFGGWGW